MSHSAQQRKQGKPRAPKKDAHHAPPSASPGVTAASTPRLSPRAAAFRARRGGSTAQAPVFTLSRAQEMMYIRDDMRRLVYVSGSLLILMLVILFIIER